MPAVCSLLKSAHRPKWAHGVGSGRGGRCWTCCGCCCSCPPPTSPSRPPQASAPPHPPSPVSILLPPSPSLLSVPLFLPPSLPPSLPPYLPPSSSLLLTAITVAEPRCFKVRRRLVAAGPLSSAAPVSAAPRPLAASKPDSPLLTGRDAPWSPPRRSCLSAASKRLLSVAGPRSTSKPVAALVLCRPPSLPPSSL